LLEKLLYTSVDDEEKILNYLKHFATHTLGGMCEFLRGFE